MATSALSRNGLIDLSKPAEYPVVLGDQLSGKSVRSQPRLINISYNHKSESVDAHWQSTITHSSSGRDTYDLAIASTASNGESTTTYSYEGSVDPALQEPASWQDLALAFDPDRRVFVLEPISAQLNFNLCSSNAKPEKQLTDRYTQLRTLQNDVGDAKRDALDDAAGDDSPADESNPYDYRHFLSKSHGLGNKPTSQIATPDPQSETSTINSPLMPTAKGQPVTLKLKPKPQSQTSPLRQNKSPSRPISTKKRASPVRKPDPMAPGHSNRESANNSKSPSPDTETSALLSRGPAPSPGSNIVVDGDLIIDMGSPPATRPAFKVDPTYFSSSNTPLDADDADEEEEIEELKLPSPTERTQQPSPEEQVEPSQGITPNEHEVEDDDELAAEMEAAFEQSAREEEEARQSERHQRLASQPQPVPSEDESEVSEEE